MNKNKNNSNEEKEEITKYRINLLKQYDIEYTNYKVWSGLLGTAHRNNFDTVEKYLEDKYKNYVNQEKKDELLKSFGKPTGSKSWGNNLIHCHQNGYNTGDDYNDMKNYLIDLIDGRNKKQIEKEKCIKILKENGYGENDLIPFKTAITKLNERKIIIKGNSITEKIENYIKYIKENERIVKENIKNHKIFCNKFQLTYLNEQQFSTIIGNAIRKLNIEDSELLYNINLAIKNDRIINYFQLILNEKLKDINYRQEAERLFKENNINLTFGGALMTAKRDYNINTGDNLEDIKQLISILLKLRKENQDLIDKKANFMIDHGRRPESWHNSLSNARTLGFNTGDPFKDLENMFEYLEEARRINNSSYYKELTNNWIYNKPEELEYLKENLIDKENILSSNNNIIGIYCWYIDGIPYYIGQSTEIQNRILDHLYNIQNFSDFWCNIKDNLNEKHVLEIKTLEIMENIDHEKLDDIEIKWINKLKPMSQKCDGTDHIIPLKLRDFNLYNLKEKYQIRIAE